MRIVLFNIVESANEMSRSRVVSGDVEVIGVDVKFVTQENGEKFCHNHDNEEKFLVSNSKFKLSIIEFAGLKDQRFVVLGNLCSHLVAGSISVNVKRLAVIRIVKKTVLCHESFHLS